MELCTRDSAEPAGSWGGAVGGGSGDPLDMSDTEQGDCGLETQHDSDSSDEDTQDTQAAGGTQVKGKGKGKADKRSKKPAVLFSAEEEQKLVDFLRDNEILYNKRLMDYKDKSKREAVWDKFCENNLDKDACQRWFQSQRTLFGKVTHMKSGQGEPLLTERQKWTRYNFDFLRRHLTAKSEFRAPKGSTSQASAAAGSSSRWKTVHTEPFQNTSRTESTCDPSDISLLDTHKPTTRSSAVSVMSSLK